MPDLSRDAILAAADRPIEAVEVPEWGGTVHVRMLSGRERDRLEAEQLERPKGGKLADFRARFAVLALCDAAGAPLFAAADVEALTQKSAAALDRVFEAAARLNRLTAADQEQLAKNSAGDRSADSGSA